MSYLEYANLVEGIVALGVDGIITDDPALLHSIVMDYSHKRSGLVPLTPPPASECIG